MSTAKQADRVSAILGAIKWSTAALSILYGVLVAIGIEGGTGWPRVFELVALTAGFLGGVLAWCLLGWMQHTLGMLTILARQGTLTVAQHNMFGGSTGVFSTIHSGGVGHGGNGAAPGRTDDAPLRPATRYHDGDSPGGDPYADSESTPSEHERR